MLRCELRSWVFFGFLSGPGWQDMRKLLTDFFIQFTARPGHNAYTWPRQRHSCSMDQYRRRRLSDWHRPRHAIRPAYLEWPPYICLMDSVSHICPPPETPLSSGNWHLPVGSTPCRCAKAPGRAGCHWGGTAGIVPTRMGSLHCIRVSIRIAGPGLDPPAQ